MAPKTEPRRAASHAAKRPITGSHLSPGQSLRLTRKASRDLFEQQSKKLLKMSGDEFRDRYRTHRLDEFEESVVQRVAAVMPKS